MQRKHLFSFICHKNKAITLKYDVFVQYDIFMTQKLNRA